MNTSELHLRAFTGSNEPLESVQADETCLDPVELDRANRFRVPDGRRRYVLNRVRLRRLLGGYLGIPPKAVVFAVDAHGKPRLAKSEDGRGLCFNLSHSGDFALFGFGIDTRLGVDLEIIRERGEMERLASACLGPEELSCWLNLQPEMRLESFFRYWVCKEAFIKATGRGLALGLKRVRVRPDFSAFENLPPEYGPASQWQLREWGSGEYRAAVVYSGSERTLTHCEPAELISHTREQRHEF